MSDRTDPDSFAQKFRLALEALNWSRTRCARELGVDKSVISRWSSGGTVPTAQNLTRFTAKLQEAHPRFQPSVWRLDPAAFAAWFQSDQATSGHNLASPSTVDLSTGRPSIAVLAFDNLSGDPADQYVADGMAEDLITELSRSRSWLVISRNASFTYKGRSVDIRQVGQELGVRYVLEGSIQRSGARTRVTVQLIEAEGRMHVWADRYDRASTDLFAMQDDIARAVSRAIEPAVETAERQRMLRKRPDSMDAWEAWQRARSHVDAEEWGSADGWFRRSIELDPGFAPPRASRALFLHVVAMEGRRPFQATHAEAEAESQAAIKLDPTYPNGYAALSMCRGDVRDWAGSEGSAARAIELAPSSWLGHCAMTLTQIGKRQFDEAARHLERMHEIGPRGAGRRSALAMTAGLHFLRGEYEEAVASTTSLVAAHPLYAHPYRILLASLGHLGRRREAAAPLAHWIATAPGQVAQMSELGVPWWSLEDSARLVAGLRAAGWNG